MKHVSQNPANTFRWVWLFSSAWVAALLCAGCQSPTVQYPPFPDQTKRIEDPTKARVYLIRPPGGFNASHSFLFWGAGPAATGPRVDPLQWMPAVPQFGIYPENPTPTSPFRMIGEVAAGAYLCWEEPPRVLRLRTETNNATPLILSAGNVYYLRATLHALSFPSVDILGDEEARALLKKCRPPDGYSGANQK